MATSRRYVVLLPVPGGGHLACRAYLSDGERDHYRACGYEVDLILNSCPSWVAEAGLMYVWFFAQDVFNFRLAHYFKRRA